MPMMDITNMRKRARPQEADQLVDNPVFKQARMAFDVSQEARQRAGCVHLPPVSYTACAPAEGYMLYILYVHYIHNETCKLNTNVNVNATVHMKFNETCCLVVLLPVASLRG